MFCHLYRAGRWRGSISCNVCKPNAEHTMVSNNGGHTQRLGHTQPLVTRAHGLEREIAHSRAYLCDVTDDPVIEAAAVLA